MMYVCVYWWWWWWNEENEINTSFVCIKKVMKVCFEFFFVLFYLIQIRNRERERENEPTEMISLFFCHFSLYVPEKILFIETFFLFFSFFLLLVDSFRFGSTTTIIIEGSINCEMCVCLCVCVHVYVDRRQLKFLSIVQVP